jgi:hypothetical protein
MKSAFPSGTNISFDKHVDGLADLEPSEKKERSGAKNKKIWLSLSPVDGFTVSFHPEGVWSLPSYRSG